MTNNSSAIEKLLPILETTFRAKQVKLARANRRIKELNAQLASLNKPKAAGLDTPANRAGADMLWDTWVQDRRKLIMQELALASRDRENARFIVASALAKLEAARKLNAQLKKEEEKIAERRASW